MSVGGRLNMRTVLSALILLQVLLGTGISPRRDEDNDVQIITQLVADYLKNWGFCFYPKYTNHGLISELESRHNEANYTIQIVRILEIDWPYRKNMSLLQTYNSRGHKMKPACQRKPEGWVKMSAPIFSADNQHALVRTEIYCGPSCGAAEWILIGKNISGWYIAQRIPVN